MGAAQDLLDERERSFAAAADAERLAAELAETQKQAVDSQRTLQAVRACVSHVFDCDVQICTTGARMIWFLC